MKHKVGDKVRIRPDLRADKEYDGVNGVDEMGTWIGEEVTISKVFAEDNGYEIEEDSGDFFWTGSMFEESMTNADKIRNMSDEELAFFLAENSVRCGCFAYKECNEDTGIGCSDPVLRWLQMSANIKQ